MHQENIPPLKNKFLHIHEFNEEHARRQVQRVLWKARHQRTWEAGEEHQEDAIQKAIYIEVSG